MEPSFRSTKPLDLPNKSIGSLSKNHRAIDQDQRFTKTTIYLRYKTIDPLSKAIHSLSETIDLQGRTIDSLSKTTDLYLQREAIG